MVKFCLPGLTHAMRASLLVGASLFPAFAFAQSFDLQALEATLRTPQSPLLQPAEFAALESADEGDAGAVRITLFDVAYAGQDLDSLSFLVTPTSETNLGITEVAFPPTFVFEDAGQSYSFAWQELDLIGSYDLTALSYTNLVLSADGLELSTEDETISLVVGQIVSTNLFSEEEDKFLSGAVGGPIEFVIRDLSSQVEGQIPNFSIQTRSFGYEPGQNPLSQLGDQLVQGFAPFSDAGQQEDSLQIRPMAVVADQSSFTATFGAASLTARDIDTVQVDLGPMSAIGSFQKMRSVGEGTGYYSFVTTGLSVQDVTSDVAYEIGAMGGIYVLEGMDFSAGSPFYSQALNDPEPGTYEIFADFIAAVGTVKSQVMLEGLSMASGDGSINFGLGSLTLNSTFDASSDRGAADISIDVSGVDLGEFSQGLFGDLSPETATIHLGLSNFDLASLGEVLRQAQRSGPVSNDAIVEADVLAMLPALAQWWANSGATLEPALLYQTPLAALQADGNLPIDPAAAYGLAGTLTATLENFETLQARVIEASSSGSLEEQQLASTLVFGLGFLDAFGQRDEAGNLVFEINVSPEGNLSVNGLPLPF